MHPSWGGSRGGYIFRCLSVSKLLGKSRKVSWMYGVVWQHHFFHRDMILVDVDQGINGRKHLPVSTRTLRQYATTSEKADVILVTSTQVQFKVCPKVSYQLKVHINVLLRSFGVLTRSIILLVCVAAFFFLSSFFASCIM